MLILWGMISSEKLPETPITRRQFLERLAAGTAVLSLKSSAFLPETAAIGLKGGRYCLSQIQFTDDPGPPDDWLVFESETEISLGPADRLILPRPERLEERLLSRFNSYPFEVQEILRIYKEVRDYGLMTCSARRGGKFELYRPPIHIVFTEDQGSPGGGRMASIAPFFSGERRIEAVWIGIDPDNLSLSDLKASWPCFDRSDDNLWLNFLAGFLAHEVTHLVQFVRASERFCLTGEWSGLPVRSELEAYWIRAQTDLVLLGLDEVESSSFRVSLIRVADGLPQIAGENWRRAYWSHPLWRTALKVYLANPDEIRETFDQDPEFKANLEQLAANNWLCPGTCRFLGIKRNRRPDFNFDPELTLVSPKFALTLLVVLILRRLLRRREEEIKEPSPKN
jgi:hypothetical protein